MDDEDESLHLAAVVAVGRQIEQITGQDWHISHTVHREGVWYVVMRDKWTGREAEVATFEEFTAWAEVEQR